MPRTKHRAPVTPRATPRGWNRPFGGRVDVVVPAPEWRGTSVQVCGLWPFGPGIGTPLVGVPIGRHLITGATVCSDPLSWFEHGLLANPSLWVEGRPGLGKSTMVRRMLLGLSAFGVAPMVFGDLKPDYRLLVEALGGNVVELGRGRGTLNVMDPGAAVATAKRLTGKARERLIADAHARRLNIVSTLIAIGRTRAPDDHEIAVLAAAMRVLDDTYEPGEATLLELIEVLAEGPAPVRAVTLDRGDDARYRAAVDPLQRSLAALVEGAMGGVFAHRTTTHIDLTKALCIDISGISEADEQLQAAALLACWGEGFAAIEGAQALTDAGLAPQRNFVLVMDELWRVIRAGSGMIDRVDAITRLDRSKGVATIMVTHTLKDLMAVSAEQRPKATGFADRAGYHAFVGVPRSELGPIRELFDLSDTEAQLLTSWVSAEGLTHRGTGRSQPIGLGKVMFKVGSAPGIPVQVELAESELAINNTNTRWQRGLDA